MLRLPPCHPRDYPAVIPASGDLNEQEWMMKPRAPILEPAPAIVAEMPLSLGGWPASPSRCCCHRLAPASSTITLPELVVAFETSFQSVQWIVLAYLLVITSLVVSAGRLGDIFGRRRSLLLGIALFAGASLLCAVAPALWQLILARGLQGPGRRPHDGPQHGDGR